MTGYFGPTAATTKGCSIDGAHCEQCGSTDHEDVHGGDQGYSGCCNELVVWSDYCRGHHLAA